MQSYVIGYVNNYVVDHTSQQIRRIQKVSKQCCQSRTISVNRSGDKIDNTRQDAGRLLDTGHYFDIWYMRRAYTHSAETFNK